MLPEVEYIVSNYPSKYVGYHTCKKETGKITAYISNIWKCSENPETFTEDLIFIFLLERICLERAFQKIRLKQRCHPCVMAPLARYMLYLAAKTEES